METMGGKKPEVQVTERMAKWLAKQPGGKKLLDQIHHPEVREGNGETEKLPQLIEAVPVSYTHLTLPTILRV